MAGEQHDTGKYSWTRPPDTAVEHQCRCSALEQANGHSSRCWYGPVFTGYRPTPEPTTPRPVERAVPGR